MSLIDRRIRERIVLVGVVTGETSEEEVNSSLNELSLLIDSAGADEVARIVQRRDRPDPATYVGTGKVEEIRETSYAVDSDTVVFDDELTPAQQRNLEKILGRTAIDRTAVILDIFAQNAHTQEGKAQVELALLRYRLPRLRGRGVTLSQQAGGIGTRGPGETQLEVDRRRLQRRITKLEGELKDLYQHRDTQRKARRRSRLHTVSFVGYTNAGKSTLLNRLTSADVLVGNRLFSTLDPATRRLSLPGGETVLASDTVGFVRKLPHQLVEAFRSTLEEVTDADLLVHVVDASTSNPEQQIEAVRSVLHEINASAIPELIVCNKTDAVESDDQKANLGNLMRVHAPAVAVSAKTGEGIDDFLTALADAIRAQSVEMELLVPFGRGDVIAAAHREGQVLAEEEANDGMRLRILVDEPSRARFSEFLAD